MSFVGTVANETREVVLFEAATSDLRVENSTPINEDRGL
jgi:hypothetical protein